MRQIATIGGKEFRDRLRSGWVMACVLVWLAAIALTSVFGLVQIGRIGVLGYERTAASLLNLTQYLVPLLGLLVGHDLMVREREERTLHLVLASGVTRSRVLAGKFLGGVLTVAVPLLVGFVVAGTVIGLAAADRASMPFLKLAASGLVLGIVFCAMGLATSVLCRSRVQALVVALVTWCVAVFAFDLVALGVITSGSAVKASQEIDVICDATHINNAADIHSAFDGATALPLGPREKTSMPSFAWIWLNPIDVFRIANLPAGNAVNFSWPAAAASGVIWVALALAAASWRLKRIDL